MASRVQRSRGLEAEQLPYSWLHEGQFLPQRGRVLISTLSLRSAVKGKVAHLASLPQHGLSRRGGWGKPLEERAMLLPDHSLGFQPQNRDLRGGRNELYLPSLGKLGRKTKQNPRLMALTKRHGSSRSQGPAHEHILFLVPGTHSAEPLPRQHGDVLSSPESPSTGNFSPCSTLVTLFWALSRTHALSHWLSQEGEGLSPWAVSRSWGWPVLTDGKADLPRPCRRSNMRAPPQPALTQSKLEVS